LLLARTYSGAPLGSSSDWSGDGIGLLTKEKVQNESDEGASSLRKGMQRLSATPSISGIRCAATQKLRLRGVRTSDQRSNQAQEFLPFWSIPSRDEKGSDFNVGDLATRGKIRLMSDEHPVSESRASNHRSPLALW